MRNIENKTKIQNSKSIERRAKMQNCELCNTKTPQSEFAPTTSPFFPAGHINLCYSCVEKNVDGNNLNQVDRFLQHCNIAFYPNEWRKMWKREPESTFRKYTSTYFDLHYAKNDWNEQNKKLEALARKGAATYELEELRPEYLAELRLTWGDLPELDLVRLEKYYNASLNDYNVQTETQRDMLRKICRISVLVDDDLSKGVVDRDKVAQYDKLMTSALKTLETTQGEGITSIGEIIAFMEQNGFQPKFYSGIPKDEIDMMMENIQEYLRDLVLGEVNLTDLYEAKKRAQERNAHNEGGEK